MIKHTNKKNSNRKTISEMIKRRRVFKEQEDLKEIDTMNDLADFIDENFEMMTGGNADDLRDLDSWSTIIYDGYGIDIRINAHVDERDGQIYFGVDQLKDIISNPVYGWEDEADYIVSKELDAHPTEDEIEEAAHDCIDAYFREDDSYDPSYSFDGKLPMTAKEVMDIIRDGAETLERDRNRMMDGLVSAIKHKLNKTESKRTRRSRKQLKEARPYIDPKNISREGIQARKELIKRANDILDVVKNAYNGHNIQFSKWMQIQCEYLQEAAKEYEKAMKDF